MNTLKLSKSLCALSGILLFISCMPSSSSAETKHVIPTEQYGGKGTSLEFLSGELTAPSSKKEEDILYQYIESQKQYFSFGKESVKDSFRIQKKERDLHGTTIIRLQQIYRGIPVWGSTQVAHITDTGVLTVLSGAIVSHLDNTPTLQQHISPQQAIEVVNQHLHYPAQYVVSPTSELVIYTKGQQPSYAYHVHAAVLLPKPISYDYFIDPATGQVLDQLEILHAMQQQTDIQEKGVTGTGKDSLGKTRILNITQDKNLYQLVDVTRGQGIYTYDAENRGDETDTSMLPGILVKSLTNTFMSPTSQAAVDAHVFAGKVYDYYKKVHARDSYDNRGAKIVSTVRFGQQYRNAFWSPELRQMVYGDGDDSTRSFTASIDVVGHEITHAITDSTSNLLYQDESGALNEALSDIFGTLVEYYQGENPDYIIGEDLFVQSGKAIRSLSDPTQYGDPDHYSKRYTGDDQSKFVHTNSGIINKTAYLIAEGGEHFKTKVNGMGKEKMGDIFYRANTKYFTASTTFSQAKASCMKAAADLYGTNSAEVQTVKQAFDAVGIK
ncbi:M4 family metallopeptidase [Bacillus cereus]